MQQAFRSMQGERGSLLRALLESKPLLRVPMLHPAIVKASSILTALCHAGTCALSHYPRQPSVEWHIFYSTCPQMYLQKHCSELSTKALQDLCEEAAPLTCANKREAEVPFCRRRSQFPLISGVNLIISTANCV